jgi:hypothetical protein
MTTQKYPEMETLPNIEPLSKPTFKEQLAGYKRYWTTRDGWIGDYVSLDVTISHSRITCS